MKKLRIPSSGLRRETIELDAEATHYALRVHRVQSGDELELFDPSVGELASAVVLEVPRSKSALLKLRILEVLEAPHSNLPLTFLCCLGKGDKPEQALRDATTLGASRVVLVLSDRVQSPHGVRETARYERVMIETARQSGQARIPQVVGPLPLVAALNEARGLRVACVPGKGSKPLLVVLRDWRIHEDITLLVGPEGGLSRSELGQLESAGFRFGHLGPSVLRAERAVAVSLGIARAYWDGVASDQRIP